MSASPPRRLSAAVQLRKDIEKAEAQGVAREDMTLHLTLSDVSRLSRDQTLAVTDISFAGGTMTYLNVRIVQGGVPVSVLRHPDAP